ncbi:MAG: hypothetical protein ACXU9W_01180, partial [Thermodesulfobacteriota bacterium]
MSFSVIIMFIIDMTLAVSNLLLKSLPTSLCPREETGASPFGKGGLREVYDESFDLLIPETLLSIRANEYHNGVPADYDLSSFRRMASTSR